MPKLKSTTKSLILSSIVVVINFLAYFSFRLVGFGKVSLLETLAFTGYISVLDFVAVFIASLIFFKATENQIILIKKISQINKECLYLSQYHFGLSSFLSNISYIHNKSQTGNLPQVCFSYIYYIVPFVLPPILIKSLFYLLILSSSQQVY